VDKLGILIRELSRRRAIELESTQLERMIKVLDESPAVGYILDSKYKLIYANPAWDSFAKANGASQLIGKSIIGFNIFDAIPSVLKPDYTHAFRQIRENDSVWQKTYDCSNTTRVRQYRMKIYFVKDRRCFLVTNSLVAEHPHRVTRKSDEDTYCSRGVITMCAHCRCAKRVDGSQLWDFVPDYLRLKGMKALKLSQGMCPVCQAHFYPHLA
jgi:hypothetical protein